MISNASLSSLSLPVPIDKTTLYFPFSNVTAAVEPSPPFNTSFTADCTQAVFVSWLVWSATGISYFPSKTNALSTANFSSFVAAAVTVKLSVLAVFPPTVMVTGLLASSLAKTMPFPGFVVTLFVSKSAKAISFVVLSS